MNQLRRSRITKSICSILVAALLLPAGVMVAPAPAHAQSMLAMTVGVVDFSNDSGVQGELLSRMATDAFVVEMSKRFDVITRSVLEQQMDMLGMKPPISRIGLVRLGEALSADAMIEGSIASVQLSGQGAARRAAVTLVVRMLDQSSGEALNGAIQTGYSNPRVGQGADDDTLITEAIDNAAYVAVKTMMDYIIPEATVQSTIRESEVMLNRGSRDGIKPGMRMLVIRDREIIGYLQVRSVSPSDSLANVTKAMRGVRPEDKARAIFDMPAIHRAMADPGAPAGAPPSSRRSSSAWKTIRTALLAVGVIYLGARLFNKDGVESVGTTRAEATIDGGGGLAVEVTWDPNSLHRGKNVIEYQVFRNFEPTPVAVAAPGQRVAIDYVRNVQAQINYQRVDPQTRTVANATADVLPLQPGTSVIYYVAAVYAIDSLQSQKTDYYLTERSMAGQATTVQRITGDEMRISSGDGDVEDSNNVDLRRVSLSWRSKRGADRYCIEVSEDANFSGALRFWAQPNAVETNAQSDGVWVTRLVVQQLHDVFYKPSRQTLYWRVGGRNSGDNPGPKPPPGRPDARWIYSQAQMFTTVEAPPDVPR